MSATGAGSTVAISGTITTDYTQTAGELIKMIFSKTYGAVPHIVLSPSNDVASNLHYFKGVTSLIDFILDSQDTPATNTTYQFDYFIAQ